MIRLAAALLVLAGSAGAQEIGVFTDRYSGGPEESAPAAARQPKPVTIEVTPTEIEAHRLSGAKLTGAWELSGDNDWFGGLSGLMIEGDRLIAVTDRAHLLRARLTIAGDVLSLSDATLWHLRQLNGKMHDFRTGDAEALTRAPQSVFISFERYHRISPMVPSGRLQGQIRPQAFEGLPYNKGIEALAFVRGEGVLAIAEEVTEAGAPYWLFRGPDQVETGHLPLASRHQVTGGEVGPDGKLYLLRRDFNVIQGISIRVERFALAAGHPVPGSREEIAAFESAGRIDNMEGLALTEAGGETHLWIISDDNFSALQRTILVRLTLTE
ncbi:MAG: esterase-like activity of phytase family protein [Pseudomonadota bacterium]